MQITGFHCKTHTLAVFSTRLVNKHCIACSHQNRHFAGRRIGERLHSLYTNFQLSRLQSCRRAYFLCYVTGADRHSIQSCYHCHCTIAQPCIPTINSRAFASHANTRSVIITICYNIYDKMHSVDGLLYVYSRS